jgi:hypothetical protein
MPCGAPALRRGRRSGSGHRRRLQPSAGRDKASCWPARPTMICRSSRQCGWVTSWMRAPSRRVPICRVQQQVGDHRGMFGLAAGGRAILAIGGDVEHRPFVDQQLGLQLQGLANVLFRAGKVLAGGERRKGLGPVVQNGGRMKAEGSRVRAPLHPAACHQPRRLATPACSSCSSASVLSIIVREYSSMARPSTRLYSPFSQVTGTP